MHSKSNQTCNSSIISWPHTSSQAPGPVELFSFHLLSLILLIHLLLLRICCSVLREDKIRRDQPFSVCVIPSRDHECHCMNSNKNVHKLQLKTSTTIPSLMRNHHRSPLRWPETRSRFCRRSNHGFGAEGNEWQAQRSVVFLRRSVG